MFGFINAYKPPGITSRDVVNIVQRRLRDIRTELGAKVKVGHAGTLDPLAEGVLVVAVGRAVRLVPYVQQQPKHYRGKFLLGQSTASGDLEGDVTHHPKLPMPTKAKLDAAAKAMIGRITQTPPAHSAIWIDGRRAYDLARQGQDVDMPTREVDIHSLSVLRMDAPEMELDIVCGSGTYIRSVGMDLAGAVGNVAVMSHLCRRGVGDFVATKAVSIERLRDDNLSAMLLPPLMAVSHLPQITVDTTQSWRLGCGLDIDRADVEPIHDAIAHEVAAITDEGSLRGIVFAKDQHWMPKRMFPVED